MEKINLEPFKPNIRLQFEQNVRKTHRNIVKALGQGMRGVHCSWTWSVGYKAIEPFLSVEKKIDNGKLEAAAHAYAEGVCSKFSAKLNARWCELEHPSVEKRKGMWFRIAGTAKGSYLIIDQGCEIVYRSGITLNLFPCYVKLDGQPITVKQYREYILDVQVSQKK